MLTTGRKFHTIKLNGILEMDSNETIEIFQRHGFNVVKLCLIGSCIDSFVKFATILKCMPNLKDIIVFETSTLCGERYVPAEQDLPELNKLKTLEMVASEYSIVKCFRKATVTTMKILNSSHHHSYDCKALEDFLKSQTALTALAFRSVHHETSMIFRTESLNATMPFHLTQLSLLNVRLQESPNDYNNLLKFLKPQTKTLNELELGSHFPMFVYEFVFANMTNLKTLSMMMSEIPQAADFYDRLEENRSVNNLIFSDSSLHNDETLGFLRGFLEKLPNVEGLTLLEYCDNKTLLAMAHSLNKLKSLVTLCFNEDIIHGVQLPNLISLSIQQLDYKVDWNEFTKAHSRLTELTVEQVFDAAFLNVDDIRNITTNVQLQTLRLGLDVAADDRFFEILRKNCPNLKTLDLHKSSVSNDANHHPDWNVLRLCEVIACPKYFKLWNEDDYDGRFPFDDENGWDVAGHVIDPFDIHLLNFGWAVEPDPDSYSDYFDDVDDDSYDVDDDSDYGRRCAD